ncbi:MAG: AMP-binding protein [Candidatus Margulisbacteria bacterium]|nr:AMP-binding protein [Candidatus Margulisiibacteriota bacterium]
MYILPEYIDKYFNKFLSSIYIQPNITYQDAYEIIQQRATYIQSLGVKAKEPVALIASNSAEWMLTYFSIAYSGAIVVALDNHLSEEHHLKMLSTVNCKHAFISDDVGQRTSKEVNFISLNFNNALSDKSKYIAPILKAEDCAAMLFTSGTTGEPKVVMLSHNNLVNTCMSGMEHMGLQDEPDIVLTILPLYHVFGLITSFLAFITNGSSIVVQPSLKGPDIIKSLETYPITVFPGVPKLWELFFDSILNKVKTQSIVKYQIFKFMVAYSHLFKKVGLGAVPKAVFKPIHKIFGEQLKFFVSGGASLKPKYFKAYHNMGFKILEGYGLTETTAAIVANKAHENREGSVGKATKGNFVEIREKNERGIGEIWLKGISVMMGYLNNDKANEEVFDNEGWFNSGDVGLIDHEGNLRITGRTKNIIVLDSGKNVFPEEIEDVFINSELINELAVFGGEKNGNAIVSAVIVPEQISGASYQEIKVEVNRLNRLLPDYMRVSDFAISFEPLPRTSTKKVIVREIIKNLKQGKYQAGDDSSFVSLHEMVSESEREKQVAKFIMKKFELKKIVISQSLDDLGLDSLSKIHFVIELELELRVKINMDKFMAISSVVELVKHLSLLPEVNEVESREDELLSGNFTTKKYNFFNPLVFLLVKVIRLKAHLFFGYRIVNKELLEGAKESIFVCNHQSNLDIILILASLPKDIRRNIFMISKKELKFLKYIFPWSHLIFVDRGANMFPALKSGADILRQGGSLIIFPEGTRTRTGKLNEFKDGAAYLASNFNKDIITMTIKGAYEVFPAGSFFPKLGHKLSLTFGEIISPKGKTVEEINKAVKKAIELRL